MVSTVLNQQSRGANAMIKKALAAAILFMSASVLSTQAWAADEKMDHGKMDHGTMDHKGMDHAPSGQDAKASATEATGTGVINSVDAAKKQVNITHEPMPELDWPKMTMDLPVTGKVDLGTVKAGDKVTFRLKLGRDKTYRIMQMSPAN
jgi:Cu(I)/Ag(I) efflux system protein CusF